MPAACMASSVSVTWPERIASYSPNANRPAADAGNMPESRASDHAGVFRQVVGQGAIGGHYAGLLGGLRRLEGGQPGEIFGGRLEPGGGRLASTMA